VLGLSPINTSPPNLDVNSTHQANRFVMDIGVLEIYGRGIQLLRSRPLESIQSRWLLRLCITGLASSLGLKLLLSLFVQFFPDCNLNLSKSTQLYHKKICSQLTAVGSMTFFLFLRKYLRKRTLKGKAH
jgi:hypothetical protein